VYIILSQRIDLKSDYDDEPFFRYHYPKRYRNQIKPGYRFIYYQGDRSKKEHRYYFGCGVIGKVEPDSAGNYYYAEILEGNRFTRTIPIYNPAGGFYESIGYAEVRNKPNPSWQNSIRKISEKAYETIFQAANVELSKGVKTSLIESSTDSFDVLRRLNEKYVGMKPGKRAKKIETHLDRGSGVTMALKNLFGPECQICGWNGFQKHDGTDFIEAHHIVQLSESSLDSLCTENIILVCPNCHREIHYGNSFSVVDNNETVIISLSNNVSEIRKNTLIYLHEKSNA